MLPGVLYTLTLTLQGARCTNRLRFTRNDRDLRITLSSGSFGLHVFHSQAVNCSRCLVPGVGRRAVRRDLELDRESSYESYCITDT